MFLLVTGASAAGKSTVRERVQSELSPAVECVELRHVVAIPPIPTLAWRQEAAEAIVRRAVEGQTEGHHLLLSGDPVAAGEVLAAPSADELDGIAVCLLDVGAEAQTARLTARGDDPAQFVHHLAFADWMRRHARDPGHRLEVLTTTGWPPMCWERLAHVGDAWPKAIHVVDTSTMNRSAVAAEVLGWCRRVLAGELPAMRAISAAGG
jgi:hypothetical protein